MIRIENLVKTFGSAGHGPGISFGVERGEVLGFLGPNGAGKSTTMRMVTLHAADLGRVTIGSHAVLPNRARGQAPDRLPAGECGVLPRHDGAGLSRVRRRAAGIWTKPQETGRRPRGRAPLLSKACCASRSIPCPRATSCTCLAQALIHDPEVLIMDEPTDGLDPNQKHEVRNLIRKLGRNKAIVFSTHILEEVDAACTRASSSTAAASWPTARRKSCAPMSDLAGAVTLSAHGASAEKLAALGGSRPERRVPHLPAGQVARWRAWRRTWSSW